MEYTCIFQYFSGFLFIVCIFLEDFTLRGERFSAAGRAEEQAVRVIVKGIFFDTGILFMTLLLCLCYTDLGKAGDCA